jgi:hypothetical protein
MSVLGDEIKRVVRSIIREQEEEVLSNLKNGEVHLFAG